MSITSMKTGTRLALGFGLTIALLIVVTATSLVRLNELGRTVDDLASSRVPKLVASGKAVEILLQSALQMRNVLLLDDEAMVKREIADIRKNGALAKEMLDQIEKLLTDDMERSFFLAVVDAREKYAPHEEEFLKVAQSGFYSSAKEIMLDRVRARQAAYIDAISTLVQYQAGQSNMEAQNWERTRESALATMLGLCLLAVLVAVGAAIFITRATTRPLRAALRAADAVAGGDLTVRIESRSTDEMGLLLEALERMRVSLAAAVDSIRRSAETVDTASREIAAGNAELSGRTEEQASSLEQTASSMEELTTTVRRNADNAKQANALAVGASDVAGRGGTVMSEVIATMEGISDASARIAAITGVIDGIAFQTNILALNAAVEAARAGEQGRGFGVVASEVRGLARRCADAAKEIKGLIERSAERVDGGTRLVEGAGKTMKEIVASVKGVTDIVSEISAASQEQLAGIEQVATAVTEMDRVVQHNAAIVEQSAAAAESMASQAQQLVHAVARFKLDADPGRSIASSADTAAPALRAATAHPG